MPDSGLVNFLLSVAVLMQDLKEGKGYVSLEYKEDTLCVNSIYSLNSMEMSYSSRGGLRTMLSTNTGAT